MTPRSLVAGFAVLGALCAASARAADDPVAQARSDAKRLSQMQQRPPDAAPAAAAPGAAAIDQVPAATFASERAAATGFVDMVRKFPEQRNEYCAYIVRGSDGKFGFSPIRRGDMNHCPSDRPKPANATATVHTHPLWGGDSDVGAAGQVFSEGDFGFAESDEIHLPIYLGAPAGHVLRYAPGGTVCKGQSLMRRDFEIVRDLRPSVSGRLPVNPGVDMPLFDVGGRKIPTPSYCRPL
jgi:hypothetical protein